MTRFIGQSVDKIELNVGRIERSMEDAEAATDQSTNGMTTDMEELNATVTAQINDMLAGIEGFDAGFEDTASNFTAGTEKIMTAAERMEATIEAQNEAGLADAEQWAANMISSREHFYENLRKQRAADLADWQQVQAELAASQFTPSGIVADPLTGTISLFPEIPFLEDKLGELQRRRDTPLPGPGDDRDNPTSAVSITNIVQIDGRVLSEAGGEVAVAEGGVV